MPIDLYKTLGYDYRDKTREAKLAVDSDVERAKRLAEVEREAAAQRSQQMEGIARKRFVENYAKTLEAGGQTEGLGEDAEAAWAKKVASGDLEGVAAFEKAAGELPGLRAASRSKVANDQEKSEADRAENKAKKIEGIAKIAGLIMPGVGEMIAKGVAKQAEKKAAKEAADVTEEETRGYVNKAIQPYAVDDELKMRAAKVAGAQLGVQQAQNAKDIGVQEYLFNTERMPLQRREMEQRLIALERENDIPIEVVQEMQLNRADYLKAQAEAARARAKGRTVDFGFGRPAGTPLGPTKRDLTADDLDFGSSLR